MKPYINVKDVSNKMSDHFVLDMTSLKYKKDTLCGFFKSVLGSAGTYTYVSGKLRAVIDWIIIMRDFSEKYKTSPQIHLKLHAGIQEYLAYKNTRGKQFSILHVELYFLC